MRMAWLKDLNRLVNGLSLVAKEIAKRSPVIETARNGDIEALIRSTAKQALVSATDLSGLTKGKVRNFSRPRPRESVVYFDRSAEAAQSSGDLEQKPPIGDDREVDNADVVRANDPGSQNLADSNADETGSSLEELDDQGVSEENKSRSLAEEVNAVDVGGGEMVVPPPPAKRRKPRERRVPTTSFSRALG